MQPVQRQRSIREEIGAVDPSALTRRRRRRSVSAHAHRVGQRERRRSVPSLLPRQQAVPATCDASLPTRVRVGVRVRPSSKCSDAGENEDESEIATRETAVLLRSSAKHFEFDVAFSGNSSQTEVFESMAKPLCQAVLKGYNATIFAYGQTGSGKTHTMLNSPVNEDLSEGTGIIPRALQFLFDALQGRSAENSRFSWNVRVSIAEIYRNEVFDLLASDENTVANSANNSVNKPLPLRQCSQRNVVCAVGQREFSVTSTQQAMSLLRSAEESRRTAHTACNRHSSRSHLVLTVSVKAETPSAASLSQFNLVDLAGSERQRVAQTSGQQLREAAAINSSLLVLGRVVRQLSSRRAQEHVRFRDSALTQLLRHSLGGNALVAVIACVSPDPNDLVHTTSTLKFAANARDVRIQAQRNLNTKEKEDTSEQNQRLREMLLRLASMCELDDDTLDDEEATCDAVERQCAQWCHERSLFREQSESLQQRVRALTSQVEQHQEERATMMSEVRQLRHTLDRVCQVAQPPPKRRRVSVESAVEELAQQAKQYTLLQGQVDKAVQQLMQHAQTPESILFRADTADSDSCSDSPSDLASLVTNTLAHYQAVVREREDAKRRAMDLCTALADTQQQLEATQRKNIQLKKQVDGAQKQLDDVSGYSTHHF
ncbi:MAG: hypothetical protein MHM6MM_001664 [Cercozoa sp. M6MM]